MTVVPGAILASRWAKSEYVRISVFCPAAEIEVRTSPLASLPDARELFGTPATTSFIVTEWPVFPRATTAALS